MSSSEVIKFLRRKTITGFDEPISYLGAEQRFVGPLRNSNNNNLEEQFLIGSDCYTESYIDPDTGDTIIKKEYHTNNAVNPVNYYYIQTWIYANSHINMDYYFEGSALRLPYDPSVVVFGDPSDPEYSDPNTLYGLDTGVFANEGEQLTIFPKSLAVSRKDELHFIQSYGSDILVSTKITGEKYKSDGITKVIVETITNNL